MPEEDSMPRIMLVDDEPNVLSSLRRTINAMPHYTFDSAVIVEIFDKPEAALVRAAECEFDLVISDWRMPSMNGIAFLNKLIQIQPNIARLVLSAYGDFHFINKPWNNDELRNLMCQALEHRRVSLQNATESESQLREQSLLTDFELRRIDQEQPTLTPSPKTFSFQDRISLSS
jgi:two-component system probable response regulator PhcQ